MAATNSRIGSVGIIGAGPSGLITAYTLLQDGFQNIQVLARDKSPGGVWARERVYPGLSINNVHGEFRFSPMEMPSPSNAAETGGRLSGDDMRAYMEGFAHKFLHDKIRYETEVLDIRRNETATRWLVKIQDKKTLAFDVLEFTRIVLCTGGCSSPFIPKKLSPSAARDAGFRGLVLHSSDFSPELGNILSTVNPVPSGGGEEPGNLIIVGGGKSAQDIAAYLSNQGRKVSVVSENFDAFLAVTSPLPDFIRKSRFLGILSPYINLRTRFERFLHTTWIGGKIVRFVFNTLAKISFVALGVPRDSPLRRTQSLFWGVRTNDEGVRRPNGFHALVNERKIHVVAPARMQNFGNDGRSVILHNGEVLPADAVILCTGYTSSWTSLFTEKTADMLGISRHPPTEEHAYRKDWNYTSLVNPPPSHLNGTQWASSIYRGIVPAKNLNHRDFAINGAVASTNNGYTYEVSAHWISSYFLGDKMRLPSSPKEASAHAERMGAWMRKRFPDMLLWANESYGTELPVWKQYSWAQAADELLDDMELPSMRSGGNWLTWPFKVIDLKEISTLAEERRSKRGD